VRRGSDDYDRDGWPDTISPTRKKVNSTSWQESSKALYHNNHDGTFTDVRRKQGSVSCWAMVRSSETTTTTAGRIYCDCFGGVFSIA